MSKIFFSFHEKPSLNNNILFEKDLLVKMIGLFPEGLYVLYYSNFMFLQINASAKCTDNSLGLTLIAPAGVHKGQTFF